MQEFLLGTHPDYKGYLFPSLTRSVSCDKHDLYGWKKMKKGNYCMRNGGNTCPISRKKEEGGKKKNGLIIVLLDKHFASGYEIRTRSLAGTKPIIDS